jgi:hypothetical protein
MQVKKMVLPMSLEGLIQKWIFCQQWRLQVEWVPPYVMSHRKLRVSDLQSVGFHGRKRIHRLFALDGAPTGPWMGRAIGACARMGRIALATSLLECWIEALEPDAWTAARGRRILEVEVQRCRNVMHWQREWPRGVLHLEDQPSWMIIPMVRYFRNLKVRSDIEVLSGGHRLLPERMQWSFPESSITPKKVSIIDCSGEFEAFTDNRILAAV